MDIDFITINIDIVHGSQRKPSFQWNMGLRINPGRGQNDQTFGASLVSVKSIEEVTSKQEQAQEYCNWRKEGVIMPLNKESRIGTIDPTLYMTLSF